MKTRDRTSKLNSLFPPVSGLLTGLFLGLILISFFFPNSYAESSGDTDRALQLVSRALDAAERNPYRPQKTKEAVYEAIHGMCRTLDPYTHFLDEESYDYMRAQQEGSFYGIGISFDIRNGQLLVISPIEDSPAWELGMRAGDVIVEIEGESTAGITSADVLTKLRGEKGSKVSIAVKRPGIAEPIPLTITRDKITLNSIRGGFILNDSTGYIRITDFSSTTARDLLNTMSELKSQGMKQLLLDLRFNGGGLLSAAEDVSSIFLEKNQSIVSTRGRDPDNHMELKTRKSSPFKDIPVIVLVNESSASASEIVAGAIQDHDDGLIIGSTTHGKGLVGSQFPNKLGTAIQITTAQYFTPSGRYIQKPFSIPHRKAVGSESQEASSEPDEKRDVHYTDKGRKVYGGGGITPDVTLESEIYTPNMITLENKRLFFDFAVDKGKAFSPITEDLEISETIYNAYMDYCREKEIHLIEEDLDTDKQDIKNAIRRELLTVYVSNAAGEKARVETQKIILKALDLFQDLASYLS